MTRVYKATRPTIRVFQASPCDWRMSCDTHGVATWCDEWEAAYEAALGHACLTHPQGDSDA